MPSTLSACLLPCHHACNAPALPCSLCGRLAPPVNERRDAARDVAPEAASLASKPLPAACALPRPFLSTHGASIRCHSRPARCPQRRLPRACTRALSSQHARCPSPQPRAVIARQPAPQQRAIPAARGSALPPGRLPGRCRRPHSHASAAVPAAGSSPDVLHRGSRCAAGSCIHRQRRTRRLAAACQPHAAAAASQRLRRQLQGALLLLLLLSSHAAAGQ